MEIRKKSLRLPLVLAGLIISAILLPWISFAASENSILVDITPENPSPNQKTDITLKSYVNNLDTVLITWSVNGKSMSSGVGQKSFSVNAPAAGSETTVTATVALPDGTLQKRVLIRPVVMALLWQADDSYVPPFYKGKALPTPGSTIRVVAIPEIKNGSQSVNPGSLAYAWQKDYTNDQGSSGYGKNSFIYTNDYLENSNIVTVTASTVDQKYSTEGSIEVGTVTPKILFYKNDPAIGTLWEEALTDGHIIAGNEVVEAAPFFISPADIRVPSLEFNWFINGEHIDISGIKKNFLPLLAERGTTGTSEISLEIENKYKIFETASKKIEVQF